MGSPPCMVMLWLWLFVRIWCIVEGDKGVVGGGRVAINAHRYTATQTYRKSIECTSDENPTQSNDRQANVRRTAIDVQRKSNETPTNNGHPSTPYRTSIECPSGEHPTNVDHTFIELLATIRTAIDRESIERPDEHVTPPNYLKSIYLKTSKSI